MYYQRVERVARAINRSHNLSSWDELPHLVRRYGSDFVELRMRGPAYDDLMKDIRKKLRAIGFHLKTKEQDPRRYDHPVTEQDKCRLADTINAANGAAFPDGDPLDLIYPWVQKQGWDIYATRKVMDNRKFLKDYLGYRYKDFDDFLASFWDQFADDNPENDMGVTRERNPWRPR